MELLHVASSTPLLSVVLVGAGRASIVTDCPTNVTRFRARRGRERRGRDFISALIPPPPVTLGRGQPGPIIDYKTLLPRSSPSS